MAVEAHTSLIRVETFKNVLMSYATGGHVEDHEYIELRRQLITDSRVKDRLPRFVFSCRSLGEFWPFIKEKFSTYAERRKFIRDEFDELLTTLETQNLAPTEEATDTLLSQVDSDHVSEAWRRASERPSNRSSRSNHDG